MAYVAQTNPSAFDPSSVLTNYEANIATANANDVELYGRTLTATTSWSPGSVANGAATTSSGITVTGAAVGDAVSVGVPSAFADGLIAIGKVTATNTVKITIGNLSGGSLTPTSGTYRATVHHL